MDKTSANTKTNKKTQQQQEEKKQKWFYTKMVTFVAVLLNFVVLFLVGFHAVTVRLYRLGRLKSVGLVVSKLEKSFDAHIAKDSSREFEHEESKYFVRV